MIGRQTILGAAVFLLLFALTLNDAGSADAKKRYSVRGLGATTCSKYLEDRNLDAKQSEQFAHWFTGFLTAYNWLKPDTYDIAARSTSRDGLCAISISTAGKIQSSESSMRCRVS
jgi:hypothetical protein